MSSGRSRSTLRWFFGRLHFDIFKPLSRCVEFSASILMHHGTSCGLNRVLLQYVVSIHCMEPSANWPSLMLYIRRRWKIELLQTGAITLTTRAPFILRVMGDLHEVAGATDAIACSRDGYFLSYKSRVLSDNRPRCAALRFSTIRLLGLPRGDQMAKRPLKTHRA